MSPERRKSRLGVGGNSMLSGVTQRRHRPDYQIILYIGLLMLLGLIIMYAIGPQRANVMNSSLGTSFYTGTYFVIKQTASLLVALMAFAFTATVPFSVIKKYGDKMLIIGFAACALLFLAGNVLNISSIVQCSLGACRWFELGPLGGFQPAELLKFAMAVYLAGFLGVRMRQNAISDVNKTLVPVGILTGLALLFTIVLQKDMGTGIALMSIIISMFIVGGIDKKLGLKIAGILLLAGVLLIAIAPHRLERVATFIQGDSISSGVSDDNSYHIEHAKIAIGTGGIFGVGIGNSVQATGYLPEAINDSVFAIMGETFGFIGLVIILTIFTALLLRILKISDHLADPSMQLFVAGVFGWLGSHVILNVASMIGVFPLTGITLPLLSFGGTSMIFISAALGIVFQLSRYTSHEPHIKEAQYENIGSRRGVGRTRHTSRRSTTGN